MRSREMSPGNPNVNEVVRVPRAGQWLKGSAWSQERLPSVASFMRQMLTGAFACQAQRGVWSRKGAQPSTPSLVGRETMTALKSALRGAHGAIGWHLGGAARREGRKGEGPGWYKAERLVTEGASGTVTSESVSQTAGKDSCKAKKAGEELSWQAGMRA